MTTSKVVSILNTREWSGPNGAVFYIQMKLENGETITLGKKSKDAFKVGDEVKYEAYTDANGKQKWREVKDNPFVAKKPSTDNNKGAMIGMAIANGKQKWREVKDNPFVAKKPSTDNNKGAMIGMAIKTAFELVYKTEKDFDKAKDLAKQILLLALEMHGEQKDSPSN